MNMLQNGLLFIS